MMAIISRIDYRTYKRFDKSAYILSIILLALVLIPNIRNNIWRSY